MARLGARIRKGTMETMKTLGTAAVARSPMTPVTNVAKAFSVPGMLQSPTVGQGLKTTNGNMVRLGDVATYINGYAFKPADWSTEGVLIIRIQDLTGNSYKANRFKGKIDKRYEVLNGDVLISWSASLGVYVWSGEKAVLNQHIFKVQFDKTQVDKSFFVHQVECILKRAIGEAHGATMKHLTKPAFDALPFYLPDVQKQKAIADLLDKISHLITLRKRQLSKLDELVKSRFVEMFGDPVENPMNWPKAQLGAKCTIITGNTPPRANPKNYGNFIEWIKSDNIVDGRLTNAVEYLSEEGFVISRYVEPGAILMTCIAGSINSIGNCAMANRRVAFNQQLNAIIPGQEYNEIFLLWLFRMAKIVLHLGINKCLKGILSKGNLSEKEFPLPPLALQREFAAFVEKVDKLEFKAKASLEKLETLKKAMMQKYFN